MLTVRTKNQSGFTLTELMITIALSMTVISSMLLGYLGNYTSTVNTLASSKLNQELTTLMSLMVGEIRRAGYTSTVSTDPTTNLFNKKDLTAMEVYDSTTSNRQATATGSGSCIVLSYDLNIDGIVDTEELIGFRLKDGVAQMRTVGNADDPDTCADQNNTWSDLTDTDFVTITTLNFDQAASECLNTREPNTIDDDANRTVDNIEEYDCYDSPLPIDGSGDITVETRQLAITVAGNLTNDDFVRLSLTQNVRVRNDWVRVR